MIRPEGFRGAAFGSAREGDVRADRSRRAAMSAALGISPDWAFATQVHGSRAVEVDVPGNHGDADALITRETGLPAAVGTADCVPVVVEGDDAVAVVHVGWRGAAAGVLERTLEILRSSGTRPRRAALGPGIGPCCYEVGSDVLERFPDHVSRTSWGAESIDLPGVVADRLAGLEVWRSAECTYTSPHLWSFRRDRTPYRQVAVGWLPSASP